MKIFSNSLYDTNIILIVRPDRNVKRRENYRLITFMNTDANTPNKN